MRDCGLGPSRSLGSSWPMSWTRTPRCLGEPCRQTPCLGYATGCRPPIPAGRAIRDGESALPSLGSVFGHIRDGAGDSSPRTELNSHASRKLQRVGFVDIWAPLAYSCPLRAGRVDPDHRPFGGRYEVVLDRSRTWRVISRSISRPASGVDASGFTVAEIQPTDDVTNSASRGQVPCRQRGSASMQRRY